MSVQIKTKYKFLDGTSITTLGSVSDEIYRKHRCIKNNTQLQTEFKPDEYKCPEGIVTISNLDHEELKRYEIKQGITR